MDCLLGFPSEHGGIVGIQEHLVVQEQVVDATAQAKITVGSTLFRSLVQMGQQNTCAWQRPARATKRRGQSDGETSGGVSGMAERAREDFGEVRRKLGEGQNDVKPTICKAAGTQNAGLTLLCTVGCVHLCLGSLRRCVF